jgi:hypothetical protein
MADRKPERAKSEALEEPDIEIGAAAKAKRLRFRQKPEVDVEVHGETREGDRRVEAESESGSVRRNLPEEVEPGVTYRDVEVGWRAEARLRDPAEDPEDRDEG